MPEGTADALTLAIVLTAGGATAAAAIITGVIQLLKQLPTLGTWLDAGKETLLAYILSAILVVLAFVQYGVQNPEGYFAGFLAWYGIATLAGGIYNQAKGLTSTT